MYIAPLWSKMSNIFSNLDGRKKNKQAITADQAMTLVIYYLYLNRKISFY